MKGEYDRKADILYSKLRESKIVATHILADDCYVDVDKEDNFVGVRFGRHPKTQLCQSPKDIVRSKSNHAEMRIEKSKHVIYLIFDAHLDL